MFTVLDFLSLFSEVFLLSAILIILIFGVLISSSHWFGCPVLNLTLGKLEKCNFIY